METLEIRVNRRTASGKGGARKIRASGVTPGVVYGRGMDAAPISFTPAQLGALQKSPWGRNNVLKLRFDDDSTLLAMVREIQTHPISREPIHADFLQVSEEKPVTVSVPIKLEGKAAGVKAGGLLTQVARTVELSCLPMNIPVTLSLDVSSLNIGEALHVKDIQTPDGVEVVYQSNYAVASVIS